MDRQEAFAAKLVGILGEENVRREEPMREHTSFRIGGPARFFVTPGNEESLTDVIGFLRENECRFSVIGNGTNLLVSDEGFDGVIVQIGKTMAPLEVRGTEIRAGAGALLHSIAAAAAEHSLAGLAFAAGIPGSLGGACIMNAGAYGGEMKDVLCSADVLTEEGIRRTIGPDEMCLGYRSSGFSARKEIVLSAVLALRVGDRGEIEAEMEDLAERRREKQPLNQPSAGSTFKRPEGAFAGKLIADAGLKGCRIGGAMVSDKHAGFIVNTGGATAADVRTLIERVRETVRKEFGIELEPEVRFLGAFQAGEL